MDEVKTEDDLICKPLTSLEDIQIFLNNPPGWRSLCVELTEHSKFVVKNSVIDSQQNFTLVSPQVFCHIDPEAKNVKRYESKLQPKTLVCHDMAGGYHDDSYLDGTGKHDAYTFYNWATIDIFCYFSHYFITIPPLGWINVGHNHGVKVIGTVITEWKDGEKLWAEILQSESSWRSFANSLVTIAKTLKFDGWLLNVENQIAKPAVLLEFVSYLHQRLHQELSHALLLWYDSVTVEGALAWQNGLNNKNRAYFDVCDGIFTNYSWTEQHVAASAAEARARRTDVFVGIDVFGRNFLGGGKFNTQEAVKIAYKHGCSLAIFAQAWTHEAMHDDANMVMWSGTLTDYDKFLLRDRAFWNTIWPYLNTKLPTKLPFKTSFCRGQGLKRRLHGDVLCPGPWYNLRHMQYQPNSAMGPHGYLLTLKEEIEKFSKNVLSQEYTGIIKYRESYHANKLIVIESDELSVLLNIEEFEEMDDNSTDKEIKPRTQQATKRKMKDVFINLFKRKHTIDPSAKQTHGEEVASNINMPTVQVKPGLPQPQFSLVYLPEELQCLEPYFEDSFVGGSCLKINPSDVTNREHRLARLFHCDFLCEESIIVCVVTKSCEGYRDQYLNIVLTLVSSYEQEMQVVLVGRDELDSDDKEQSSPGGVGLGELELLPLNSSSNPKFREIQRYMLLEESGFYMPVENSYGWKVKYYEVRLPRARVTAVLCRAGRPTGPVLLGHLGLCARSAIAADKAS